MTDLVPRRHGLTLESPRVFRALMAVAVLAAIGMGFLVRSFFSGVILTGDAELATEPRPGLSDGEPGDTERSRATPAPAASRSSPSPSTAPGRIDPARRLDPAPSAPRVPASRSHAAVRLARQRYREIEAEVQALGGADDPRARTAVEELERAAAELRRAEAALDRSGNTSASTSRRGATRL